MLDLTITAVLGSIALALNIAATVLNGIFAIALASTSTPDILRLLLFIAFALNIACIVYLVFFTYISIRKISNHAASWSSKFRWRMLVIGVVLAIIALVVTVIPLIWLSTVREDLPHKIALQMSELIYILWLVIWGSSILAQAALYTFIGRWTKHMQRPASVQDLDFGIRMPPTGQFRSDTTGKRNSYNSQDPTLASPPRTPRTPTSSVRNSSSTKVGPGSSRVKLVQKGSARSSLDFPAGEAQSIDSAFDRWDTSSVHHEIRAGIHSSPPVTRSGLETIPGSRPESPADALDGPFLPESPNAIHAISSDAATAIDFYPSSPPHMASSPPSSPPNFSRPTSRDQHKPVPNLLGSSMEELIHPLFRPNSPRPPPIAIAGTMVTAAPNAGGAITPRTLSRMRSGAGPTGWKSMPSPSIASSTGSPPASPTVSQGPGSPGPSIAEEENLPPILPGFVLSAGQRSSLQWYSRRKSTKERPISSYSRSSRRSSMHF